MPTGWARRTERVPGGDPLVPSRRLADEGLEGLIAEEGFRSSFASDGGTCITALGWIARDGLATMYECGIGSGGLNASSTGLL